MVRSAKFWVEASGMAKSTDRGLEPTTAREAGLWSTAGRDRFMEDIQTLWLIHWNLSTHVEDRLFAWDFLFSRWHAPEFAESSVLKAFAKEVDGRSRKLSLATLQQHLQVFLHTYVPTRGRKGDIAEDNLDCPLTELEMLIKIGDRAEVGIAFAIAAVCSARPLDGAQVSPGLRQAPPPHGGFPMRAYDRERVPLHRSTTLRASASESCRIDSQRHLGVQAVS